MEHSSRSNKLVVSMACFVLALSILLLFAVATSMPYTQRPLQYYETPTPDPTAPVDCRGVNHC
ncbi:hypothetical protein [Ktedonospora formicarum]|uniref:hypothetical protein n=1 Tax=Ktedonospora formicarum TaxID=2778364 RepID=UPI001C691F19|nr:hypothetical protein [Ktedonospora formicarum]